MRKLVKEMPAARPRVLSSASGCQRFMGFRFSIKILFVAIGILAGTFSTASSQEEVFQRGIEFGVGARALGMGGAYIGVSDDYSAAFWNPAALTQIRRIEGFATLGHAQRKNDVTSSSSEQLDEASFTSLNSLGLAYPIPTYRGSLVFSLGYHRVRPYDGSFSFSWFNNTAGDSVGQRWSELEEGSLNNWTLAVASEVAPNFSVGAGLNIWSGQNDYQYSFIENDPLDLYTFNDYRYDNGLVSKFSGVNFKLAGMYHPSSLLRVGVTLATPTTLTVKDTWQVSSETDGVSDDGYPEAGNYEYKIRSPFSLGTGASINLLNLLISGSAEFNDWSQIRYTTEPPIEGLSETEANDELARNYRATTRLRLGAEFTVPIIDLQVRAGYFYDPIPLANMPKDADREFFTAGLGIFLDKQVRLDLAVMTGEWQAYNEPLDDLSGDTIPVSEKIRLNQAFATLAFRF